MADEVKRYDLCTFDSFVFPAVEIGVVADGRFVTFADYDRLARELAEARSENNHLRARLANSGGPCAYCTLPREDWARCQQGFPGCSRADDAMLCPYVGSSLELMKKPNNA